jgi:hypothetical protein
MISSLLEARSEELTPEAIVEAARDLALTKWCSGWSSSESIHGYFCLKRANVAIALTILFYDTFLTFGEEVSTLHTTRFCVYRGLVYQSIET